MLQKEARIKRGKYGPSGGCNQILLSLKNWGEWLGKNRKGGEQLRVTKATNKSTGGRQTKKVAVRQCRTK